MEGNEFLIVLNHFERFGPRRLKRLFDFFSSWEAVWNAAPQELQECGLSPQAIELFLDFRKTSDPQKILENIFKKDIKIVLHDSPLYPSLLREIYDPPLLLYYRGELTEETFSLPLAVVGTRKVSNYGKQAVRQITQELCACNIAIVSGLALGVDCLAHEAALEADGITIAFLGSGVDQIYPRTNYHIGEQILAKGGLILSEFAPGTLPFKTNFPRRNRLIAGSSLGTLVIEAAEKSGALITARYALEEGREVFAVPGSIFSDNSIGPHNLLRAGARLVSNAQDICSTLGLEEVQRTILNQRKLPLTSEESVIFELLGAETVHVNELARLANLDITVVNSRLTIMEMKGLVKHIGGMHYVKMRQTTQH